MLIMYRSNVKYYREMLEISQLQLAKDLGVSRQTINGIETGRQIPTLILAHKLAEYFSVSIETLFFWQGH